MPEEKRVKQVVTTASKRKTPIGEKLAKTFLKGDNLENIGQFLVQDVVIPAIVDTVVDFIQRGTNMLFYGDNSSRGTSRNITMNRNRNREQYNRISSLGASGSRRDAGVQQRGRTEYNRVYKGYEGLFIESRGDAEEILDSMDNLVQDYDCVSVADLYDLVGITTNYTDNKWGWYKADVACATIRRVRGGWTIDLPEPEPLD